MMKLRRYSSFVKLLENLPKSCATNSLQCNLKYPNFVNATNDVDKCRMLCTSAPKVPADLSSITNGDAEIEHRLKVLMLEVEVMRQEGKLVPEFEALKDKHWTELLRLRSLSARRKYLEFLFKLSKTKENRAAKKEIKRLEREKTKPVKNENETFEEFVSKYDLSHNSIFLRFYDSTINQFYNNRLIQAMQYGQKLVVDCGYDMHMTKSENSNCAKQLMLLFAENRNHDAPFDLHYCNLRNDTPITRGLEGFIAPIHEPWFPLNVHESSYLDLFPKQQLVYLTPHCREEMLEYDHDAIYIIGGIVDKSNTEPLSLAKAKKEGLRMAKFPLDRYLQWGSGSGKSLTLNHVASILNDLKVTGDWRFALRHVPKRKLTETRARAPPNNWKTGKPYQSKRPQIWRPSSTDDYSGNRKPPKNKLAGNIRDIFND